MLKLDAKKVAQELLLWLDNGPKAATGLNLSESRMLRRIFSLLRSAESDYWLFDEEDDEETLDFVEGNQSIGVEAYEDFVDDPSDEGAGSSTSADPEYKPPAKRQKRHYTFKFIKTVLDYREDYLKKHGKYPTMKTLESRYKVPDHKTIERFKKYYQEMGTQREKFQKIAEYVYEKFVFARHNGCILHDRNIRIWALVKAKELNLLTFKASPTWILQFKKLNRITGRKVTRFVSRTTSEKIDELQQKTDEFFKKFQDDIYPNFTAVQIFNIDECGVNYELHSARTLSHLGEKDTEAKIKSEHSTTHSYTIVPMLSMDGALKSPLFICLQEAGGEFGPRVTQSLYRPANVIVDCTKSGKLEKSKLKIFVEEVVKKNVEEKACLVLDSWSPHKDATIFEIASKTIERVILPEGSTSLIQPLDVGFFRYWKHFIRRFTETVLIQNFPINLSQRNNIIKINAVIHNQFSAPAFKPLFEAAWERSGYETGGEKVFQNLNELCFTFNDSNCSVKNCKNLSFVKCAWCEKIFCVSCILEPHFHFQ